MAEDKGNESSEKDTSTTHFREAEGKIVKSIELTAASDYYGINVKFHRQHRNGFQY